MPTATRDLEGDYALVEAAHLLGVSLATLNRWVAAGQAPPSYRLGSRRWFPKAEFARWLDETRAAAK
jgi:excisionase family DNA binding protein